MEDTIMTHDSDSFEWYVVHTYSGYENNVKANIEKSVENNGMHNLISDIVVPTEDVEEIKNGKRKMITHKLFPGYVLVKMKLTDESWYVVRNTRGVTGFVGSGTKPIPLTEDEVKNMLGGGHIAATRIDMNVGDNVRILSGPLENFTGEIEEIDELRLKIRVVVSMFGRKTPVDLEYDQIVRV